MFIKPNEQSLSPELESLRDEAWRATSIQWDGWYAEPLTRNQIFQINYIVNKLIENAINKTNNSQNNGD